MDNKIQPNAKSEAAEAKPMFRSGDLSSGATVSGAIWATARRTKTSTNSTANKEQPPTNEKRKAIRKAKKQRQ